MQSWLGRPAVWALISIKGAPRCLLLSRDLQKRRGRPGRVPEVGGRAFTVPRKARRLSQEDVAKQLGEGHSRSKQLISHWENGRNEITSYDLYRLAQILDVGISCSWARIGTGRRGSSQKPGVRSGPLCSQR